MLNYFKGLFKGIISLLKGLGVTLKIFFEKKVTSQYPENRKTLQISPRFRAMLSMSHDENNCHACTACSICQMNCPNGTIKVIAKQIPAEEEGKTKRALDRYIYDLGKCTFCNLCVISCPQKAIEFSNNFESAAFTREKLVMQLNCEGSKLREKIKN
ncbi:MAG: 4Fe-4S dicluster domain-containing protein [Prevotellaceae bacterium]|jgi:NADH-quinone oxidoreductase subunit I|nr:4Fe-4S dicluster domain-containing protein [Prevotellaceae bacterium]